MGGRRGRLLEARGPDRSPTNKIKGLRNFQRGTCRTPAEPHKAVGIPLPILFFAFLRVQVISRVTDVANKWRMCVRAPFSPRADFDFSRLTTGRGSPFLSRNWVEYTDL
ncbi:hypothetical protein GWI33_016099 [Rhynchophorus ferrugineus]|uniref:Uncharacterized protein n=1 Tax=Rhynchophorus ferrugineus TaxID=354439 RepID=A0A834I1W2_RHYFE|nr:hypothetical protein GWI33_016099 [Rhynchophorus ferrugineus]